MNETNYATEELPEVTSTEAERLTTEAAITTGTKPAPKIARRTFWHVPYVRLSGIKSRLLYAKSKGETFLKALDFARNLVVTLGMRPRTAALSVKQQFHLTTRQARLAVRDAKPKKHRRR